MRRIAAILLALGMLVVTASPAVAEDHGSWSNNCVSGRACMWRTDCFGPTGEVKSSPTRDSNFTNDYFASGTTLNNHIICGDNNFNTISIRVYTGLNYGGSASVCFGPGIAVGSYNNTGGEPGLTSFKGC